MQYHTTKNYFLRFAFPGCAMLLVLATLGIVNSAATAGERRSRPPTLRQWIGNTEGSQEAKDIVIPEFSTPRINLDLIIPFNRNVLITKARSKRSGTIKPYVIRTIKVKVRKP